MLKPAVVAAVLLASAQAAQAQPAPPIGGQLQQIPPPVAPRKPASDMGLNVPTPPADAPPSGPSARVDRLRISGATLYSEAELVAASGFAPGAQLTLPELGNQAAAIARFYNSRGYFLAQAYLPAQAIEDGTVTIVVVEGHYGTVSVRNTSGLAPPVADRILRGLDSGDAIAIAPLERRLLLLSDIPGVSVRSTLSPGAAVGTSDLVVDIAEGRRITGSLEADNGGNRYTGQSRLGGSLNFNNPTGLGDQISLRILASTEGLA